MKIPPLAKTQQKGQVTTAQPKKEQSPPPQQSTRPRYMERNQTTSPPPSSSNVIQIKSRVDVKKVYKTKKFFDEVASATLNGKDGGLSPEERKIKLEEQAKINQQYFALPSVIEEPPQDRSIFMQTLKEISKLRKQSNLVQQEEGGGVNSPPTLKLIPMHTTFPETAVKDQSVNTAGILKRGVSKLISPVDIQVDLSLKKNSFEGKYRWWINPSEPYYVKWILSLLIFNIIWIHVILPVRLSLFQTSVSVYLYTQIIDLVCDIANFADSIMQFYIPLIEIGGSHNSGYIFERKIVAMNYFKTWFLIDTFSNIPFSIFYRSFKYDPKLYLIFMSLKLIRVRKAHSGLRKLVRKLGFGVVTIRFSLTLWNIFMMLHLTACLWGTIGEINLQLADTPDNWITHAKLQDVNNPLMKYLNNLYWASVTIMTVGYGDIVPRNTDELIVACFVMLFGICLFTYNLSSLAQQFAEIIKTNSMRGEQHQWAIEYLYHIPNLDERLILKIEQYINANILSKEAEIFHQKISLARQDEDVKEILNYLTPSLKGQLTLFLYKDAIHRIPFLQGRDPKFYLQYLDKLEPLKFQKDTVMLKRGTVAQRLFFIVKGKVLNSTINRIYSDGAVVGETEIIFKSKRRDNFIAIDEMVHVLKLDARVLREAMEEFPDIKSDMQDLARQRAMTWAEHDPNFQMQLIDFKEKMNVMLNSFQTEQVEEDIVEESDNDNTQSKQNIIKNEEPKIVLLANLSLPGNQREKRNGPLMKDALGKIDFDQLQRKNNTQQVSPEAKIALEDHAYHRKLGELVKEDSKGLKNGSSLEVLGSKLNDSNESMLGNLASFRNPRLEAHPISPLLRNEERKSDIILHQNESSQFQICELSDSRNSLNALPFLRHSLANYGRDSNVYKSLEQRLVRNQQLMEQLIFHTKRSKLSLIQHQQRFQDYIDGISNSAHHHLVNEEIIETTQQAIQGITRYMNVLQLLEANLEQSSRVTMDDLIKEMKETLKVQENQTSKTERMMERLGGRINNHKQQNYSSLQSAQSLVNIVSSPLAGQERHITEESPVKKPNFIIPTPLNFQVSRQLPKIEEILSEGGTLNDKQVNPRSLQSLEGPMDDHRDASSQRMLLIRPSLGNQVIVQSDD